MQTEVCYDSYVSAWINDEEEICVRDNKILSDMNRMLKLKYTFGEDKKWVTSIVKLTLFNGSENLNNYIEIRKEINIIRVYIWSTELFLQFEEITNQAPSVHNDAEWYNRYIELTVFEE